MRTGHEVGGLPSEAARRRCIPLPVAAASHPPPTPFPSSPNCSLSRLLGSSSLPGSLAPPDVPHDSWLSRFSRTPCLLGLLRLPGPPRLLGPRASSPFAPPGVPCLRRLPCLPPRASPHPSPPHAPPAPTPPHPCASLPIPCTTRRPPRPMRLPLRASPFAPSPSHLPLRASPFAPPPFAPPCTLHAPCVCCTPRAFRVSSPHALPAARLPRRVLRHR